MVDARRMTNRSPTKKDDSNSNMKGGNSNQKNVPKLAPEPLEGKSVANTLRWLHLLPNLGKFKLGEFLSPMAGQEDNSTNPWCVCGKCATYWPKCPVYQLKVEDGGS